MRRLREPLAESARDLGVAQLGLDALRRHEVLPNEGAEALTELILLLLDDRGVRDRDPKRMFEQRGAREPVGPPPAHARLGGGPDVSNPWGRTPACRAVGLRPG